jgi:hypothetical protein
LGRSYLRAARRRGQRIDWHVRRVRTYPPGDILDLTSGRHEPELQDLDNVLVTRLDVQPEPPGHLDVYLQGRPGGSHLNRRQCATGNPVGWRPVP